MSANLQKLLRESLLNNSYDYESMHSILKTTWENSYSYLYSLQKSYIGYEELHYFSNDTISRNSSQIGKLYLNKLSEACFDIDYDFIHVCNREEFYHSDYYSNIFSFTDMVDHPEIFHKLPIIMIDNKTIWDYRLKANIDTFTIILPFNRSFVIDLNRNQITDDIIYLDHKIEVMVVDNTFYERVRLNKYNLTLNSSNKTVSLSTSLLSSTVTNKEGIYFLSVHNPNSTGNSYELGTTLYACKISNNKLTATVGDSDFDTISSSTLDMYISVIFINELHTHTLYTGNDYVECTNNECNLFMLQRSNMQPYSMPIPVEDLLVMKYKKSDKSFTLVCNTDTVEMYYPNIYRIKDESMEEGDQYHIHYFYHYADFLAYTPIHDFFYQFLTIRYNQKPIEEIIDTIYHGTADMSSFSEESLEEFKSVFEKIMNYQYYNHQYGEVDFCKRYITEKGNEDKKPVEYKDETLRKWIDVEPNVLRDYVIEQNKLYTPVYHLWTNTLNLSSRYRKSTKPEMGDDGFDLDEQCYVFAFRNDNTTSGKLLDARIFVDGIFVVNMHQTRYYFTDYFYIPTSMVTDDSYIEIEIFPSYSYTETFNFKSLDEKKSFELFEPEDQIYPTAQDLYYIEPSGHLVRANNKYSTDATDTLGNDTVLLSSEQAVSLIVNGTEYEETHIYDNDFFKVTARYDDGDFTIETIDEDKPVKFTRLNRFEIQPISDNVLNKDISLCISKIPNGMEVMIEESGYPYIALVENQFKFNIDYIRIFKNGRLLPRQKYTFFSSYSFPRIYFLDYFNAGDIIYIDITSYRYKEIYYQQKIEDDRAIIDLKDIITKPFDIRYYDVYMNGRKLSLNNVFTISPWQIVLTNLESPYNLQIFEKERDWEYFGTNYKETQYYYTIEDLFNSSFITDNEKNEIIQKIIEDSKDDNLTIKANENREAILDFNDNRTYAYFPMFYFNELIPKTYVNPDRIQFDNTVLLEEYPLIMNTYTVVPENSSRNETELERRKRYLNSIELDPDIYVEGGKKKGTQYVFSVGHLLDVDDEYLNDNIIINNDPDIESD